MARLYFTRNYYDAYGTTSINVFDASFEDCEILDVNDTEYGYQKAVVKLSPKKITIIKEIEEKVTEYLSNTSISPITIEYGNRIYPMKKICIQEDTLKNIKFKGVWVNDTKKFFPQLWLE